MVAISASWAEAPAGEDTAAISASWAEAPIKDPLDGPAEPEPCSFCPGGVDDPSRPLSADNGVTCGSIEAHIATAMADNVFPRWELSVRSHGTLWYIIFILLLFHRSG